MAATVLPSVIALFLQHHPRIEIDLDATGRSSTSWRRYRSGFARRGAARYPSGRQTHRRDRRKALCHSKLFQRRATTDQPDSTFAVAFAGNCQSLASHRRDDAQRHHRGVNIVRPRLAANDHQIVLEAMLAEIGIANFPMFLGEPLVEAKKASIVLPQWTMREVPLYLIYPSHKSVSLALRTLLDHLVVSLTPYFP